MEKYQDLSRINMFLPQALEVSEMVSNNESPKEKSSIFIGLILIISMKQEDKWKVDTSNRCRMPDIALRKPQT